MELTKIYSIMYEAAIEAMKLTGNAYKQLSWFRKNKQRKLSFNKSNINLGYISYYIGEHDALASFLNLTWIPNHSAFKKG